MNLDAGVETTIDLWDDIPTTGAPSDGTMGTNDRWGALVDEHEDFPLHPLLDGGFAGWCANHGRFLVGLVWTLLAVFLAVVGILVGRLW